MNLDSKCDYFRKQTSLAVSIPSNFNIFVQTKLKVHCASVVCKDAQKWQLRLAPSILF